MTALTVATYNLYLGADLTLIFGARDPEHLRQQAQRVYAQLESTNFAERADAIAKILVRERVDVVGLQEVARWERAPIGSGAGPGPSVVWCDFLDLLLRALSDAASPYDVFAASASFAGSSTISDEELVSVLGHNVVLVRRGSGVAVLSEATGEFRRRLDIPTGMRDLVLSVPRSWGSVRAEVDGFRFVFANTHTEAYDEATRNAQRDELLDVLDDPPDGVDGPVVLVGDFNSGPGTVGMPAAYQDAWLVAGTGQPTAGGNTCGQAADLANAASSLSERIDYVWVRGARVADCRVVGNTDDDRTAVNGLWPSDHACVLARVVF